MITAFKQQVTIKSGGLVSLRSRKLKAGTRAEVIVLVEHAENPAEKFSSPKPVKQASVMTRAPFSK